MHDLFTDCNASSKVWLIDLEVLNYQKDYGNMSRGFKAPRKLWLMFLRINNIDKGTIDNFTGCKILRKIKSMC